MSMFYLVLALLFSLLIAVVAMVNGETVAVNYLFGQARLPLIVLILGSACSGALALGFFGLYRSIRTHLKFREVRHEQEDMQHRVEFLEKEKARLEAEVGRRQIERETADAKEHNSEKTLHAEDDPEPSLG